MQQLVMMKMSKFFIAMYDEDDYPYMMFENYKECAKFFKTSQAVITCNISRHQKKKYKGKFYSLHKIRLNKSDIEINKTTPNLHIGAILEVLNI